MTRIKFELDFQQVEAEAGETIWQVAKRLGRDIPHILLIHVGAFTALTLDAVLKDWRSRGVEFISLEEALADPSIRVREKAIELLGISCSEDGSIRSSRDSNDS